MKPLGKDYNDATATQGGAFKKLPAGGYICKITDVKDCPAGFNPDKPESGDYLRIYFDIADGEYKGFYSDDFGAKYPDIHSFIRSYKPKALGMFKGFLQAVDDSNGTALAGKAGGGLDEKQLIGKLVGLVLGYEEYVANMGEIREKIVVTENRSVAAIKSGDFKVPELKRVKDPVANAGAAPSGFTEINDDDIPF